MPGMSNLAFPEHPVLSQVRRAVILEVFMQRVFQLLLPAAAMMAFVSGCAKESPVPPSDNEAVNQTAVVSNDVGPVNGAPDYANMAIEVPGPGAPGGLPDDRTPISEAPAPPGSGQAAATVVETYFALLEQRRFDEAKALWQDNPPDLAAQFADYARMGANIGAPGRVDVGAGQAYVQIPVQQYGRLKDGIVVNGLGKVTLHRVNGVDGATPEQLKWHITEIDVDAKPLTKTP